MNAPTPLSQIARAATRMPALDRILMAALAEQLPGPAESTEAAWLERQALETRGHTLAQWQAAPSAADARLHALSAELPLHPVELVALALAVAVEFDAMLGRALAWLQAPVGGARPTLGLLATLCETLGLPPALPIVHEGRARHCGLLQLDTDNRPLPELAFRTPVPVALALQGHAGGWPGLRLLDADREHAPASIRAAAALQAQALQRVGGVLAVRCGHVGEALDAAALVVALMADRQQARAACFDQDPAPGAGPWLWLRGAVPVLTAELAPGETRRLPELPGYRGPLLVATGLDGSFERGADPVASWSVPLPLAGERTQLWQQHLGADPGGETTRRLGREHRHSASQIARLSQAARRQAALDGIPVAGVPQVRRAARQGAAAELGTMAHLIPEHVPDEALVVPDDLHQALLALQQRCQRREGLADELGPAARTRYRPGVRALLVGPSGTGKTLAAGWLATRLGLPLYRIDLAAVTSKYIGETEKNLAQLFGRAEQAEVLLLFDEADSLFGKRTDVKDSNDRYANQQTNYLLQRIESFEGIAILTSNSRARFDSAFTRRLDAIVDFPSPGPQERRALWLAHLGDAHRLEMAQINRMAAGCDLAGGHIRSATLAAAGACDGRPIDYPTLRAAIEAEYRKLGRQVPAEL